MICALTAESISPECGLQCEVQDLWQMISYAFDVVPYFKNVSCNQWDTQCDTGIFFEAFTSYNSPSQHLGVQAVSICKCPAGMMSMPNSMEAFCYFRGRLNILRNTKSVFFTGSILSINVQKLLVC